jgi:hypothetical protein
MKYLILPILLLIIACESPTETTVTAETDTLYSYSVDTVFYYSTVKETLYLQTPTESFTGIKTTIITDGYDNVESTIHDYYENNTLVKTEEFNSQNNLIKRTYYTPDGDTTIVKVFG